MQKTAAMKRAGAVMGVTIAVLCVLPVRGAEPLGHDSNEFGHNNGAGVPCCVQRAVLS